MTAPGEDEDDDAQTAATRAAVLAASAKARAKAEMGLQLRFMGHEGRTLTPAADLLLEALAARGVHDTVVSAPPLPLVEEYRRVFTVDAVQFVADMCRTFDGQIGEMLRQRDVTHAALAGNMLPGFLPHTTHMRRGDWKIDPLPPRLRDRRCDIGDVVTHDARILVNALNSGAQGVQADFDDGHCPTWERTILGLDCVIRACQGTLYYTDPKAGEKVGMRNDAAVMMTRPRAWNMRERHVMVAGREVLGAMVDFALVMFHAGKSMLARGVGPFFYLSKIETHVEARLWNDIFTWTERKLGLPDNCVKGCVLIESVLASFEAEEILYELRTHSAGLNCGMWDYAASFISKFRHRPEFVLPDRSVYVNMNARFMKSYRDNVIKVCHRRGAPATGGMHPTSRPGNDPRFPGMPVARRDVEVYVPGAECAICVRSVHAGGARTHGQLRLHRGPTLLHSPRYEQGVRAMLASKRSEVLAGVDGAMVYDTAQVPLLLGVFADVLGPGRVNQIDFVPDVEVQVADLLALPKGKITLEGLKKNVLVGVRFIEGWLSGWGQVIVDGMVEDSATAEISRSQIWQWLRHCAKLEDGRIVTRVVVRSCLVDVVQELRVAEHPPLNYERVKVAARLFEELVNLREMPRFITTWLLGQSTFWRHSDVCWL